MLLYGFFPLEIEADVEVERAKGIVEAHLLPVIVEGMEDERRSGIPFRVVIDQPQTPDEVEV